MTSHRDRIERSLELFDEAIAGIPGGSQTSGRRRPAAFAYWRLPIYFDRGAESRSPISTAMSTSTSSARSGRSRLATPIRRSTPRSGNSSPADHFRAARAPGSQSSARLLAGDGSRAEDMVALLSRAAAEGDRRGGPGRPSPHRPRGRPSLRLSGLARTHGPSLANDGGDAAAAGGRGPDLRLQRPRGDGAPDPRPGRARSPRSRSTSRSPRRTRLSRPWLRDLAHEIGALLIFDEIVTGFRMANGGAQEYFGVTPDLAVFTKALATGCRWRLSPVSRGNGEHDGGPDFDHLRGRGWSLAGGRQGRP